MERPPIYIFRVFFDSLVPRVEKEICMKITQKTFYFLIAFLALFGLISCKPNAADAFSSLDLLTTKSITINNNWSGLSPLAPINSSYSLKQAGDHFEGDASFSVGGFFGETKTDTAPIRVPDQVIQDFLQKLSRARPVPGEYKPNIQWTDDYPQITISLVLENMQTVVFYTESQGDENIPWKVTYNDNSYIIDSGIPAQALGILLPYLAQDNLQNLISQVK